MRPYSIDPEAIAGWAAARGYRKLLLQAPDGIKRYAVEVAEELEDRGFEVLLSASHAWGGCDVALAELAGAGCDALVHVGHHGPVRFRAPKNVLFVPAYSTVEVDGVLESAAAKLSSEGVRKVGLISSVQHVHQLERARRVLAEYGIEALTSKSPDPAMPEGLVIGCDARAAEKLRGSVDAFLVIAGGVFHALGVALATGAATYAADPYTGRVAEVGQMARKAVARRLADLAAALEARSGLLIASVKPGQRVGWSRLESLRGLLSRRGLRLRVAVCDDVTRDALQDYGGADVYINAACPRLAVDDAGMFPGPVANARELELVLEKGLERYEPRYALLPP